MPFFPYSGACVSNSIAPETVVMPGVVLMIWSAGRNTSPVVLRAPANCPSASLFLMIRHPKYKGLRTNLRASSIVIPFFLRNSHKSCAYSSIFGWFSGSMMVALLIFPNPHLAAASSISFGFPIRIRSATSSVNI